jgi:hypothetical protein
MRTKSKTSALVIAAPVGGLNASDSIMRMPQHDCLILDNFIPLPDRLVTRPGCSDWVTGFAHTVERLWVHSNLLGGESLWATTADGVFDCSTSGAVGAAAVALTNGKTIGLQFSTGANNYLFLVNGTDTMKQYDGTSWTSVATLGATATTNYSFIDSYRQRIFLVRKGTMNLEYLAANAIAGAPTSYAFSSIFKKGGYIVATDSWTIDGGQGSDDLFAIGTSQGEIAIFSGNDPATWSLKGVFTLPRPLGPRPFFKYGGDLLYLGESGIYPLSKALQSAQIDRTQNVSQKIKQLFTQASAAYFANDGWQIIAQPDIPLLLVTIPATPNKFQFCMHPETGAWTRFSGWDAACFGRKGAQLYFGGADSVSVVSGLSDYGANIVCTALGAYSAMGYPKKKHVKLVKPYFLADNGFSYVMGFGRDFQQTPSATTMISGTSTDPALWGTGIWGTALWSGQDVVTDSWRSLPDQYSNWKAFYIQVAVNKVEVSYLGADFRIMEGSDF